MKKNIFIIALLVCLDQITKFFFQLNSQTIFSFGPYLKFFLVWNQGLSLGLLPYLNKNIILFGVFRGVLIVSTVCLIRYYSQSYQKLSLSYNLSYILLISGALGNTFDRLWHQKVCDFIHLFYHPYYFPAFNFADMYVTIGILLLIISDYSHQNNQEK